MPRVKIRTTAQNSALLQKVARRLELAIGDMKEVAFNDNVFATFKADELTGKIAEVRNEIMEFNERIDLHPL